MSTKPPERQTPRMTNDQKAKLEDEAIKMRFKHQISMPGGGEPRLKSLVQELATLKHQCKKGTLEQAEAAHQQVLDCIRRLEFEFKKAQHGIKLMELERQRDEERRLELEREVERVFQLSQAEVLVEEPFPGKSEAEQELQRLEEQIEDLRSEVRQKDLAMDIRRRQFMFFFSLLEEMSSSDSILLQNFSEVSHAVALTGSGDLSSYAEMMKQQQALQVAVAAGGMADEGLGAAADFDGNM